MTELERLVERLRELSTWLTANDVDMQMPEGMLDPEIAADALLAERARAEKAEKERDAQCERANGNFEAALSASDRADTARARKALEDALRPFAKDADRYDPMTEGDDRDLIWDYGHSDLRVGDLRRARSALGD